MAQAEVTELVRRLCDYIYERHGASGVYEALKEYRYWVECLECDTETPHFGGECLLCGTEEKENDQE